MTKTSSRYSPEVPARAVRTVLERQADHQVVSHDAGVSGADTGRDGGHLAAGAGRPADRALGIQLRPPLDSAALPLDPQEISRSLAVHSGGAPSLVWSRRARPWTASMP